MRVPIFIVLVPDDCEYLSGKGGAAIAGLAELSGRPLLLDGGEGLPFLERQQAGNYPGFR
jgi:hypothetical protein